jgi:hypothetical protein
MEFIIHGSHVLVLSILLGLLFCTRPVSAEPFQKCGSVYEGLGCRWFQSYDGEIHAALTAPFPDSLFDKTVNMEGDLVWCTPECMHLTYPCITRYSLSPCIPTDFGCGILSEQECDDAIAIIWRSLSSPLELAVYPTGYSAGDTIGVTGILQVQCISICALPSPCLVDGRASYRSCSTTAAKKTSWGFIKSLYR